MKQGVLQRYEGIKTCTLVIQGQNRGLVYKKVKQISESWRFFMLLSERDDVILNMYPKSIFKTYGFYLRKFPFFF